MFGDPGIDPSIYNHYLKNEFGDKLEKEPVCDPKVNEKDDVVIKNPTFYELKMDKDYRPIIKER